MENWSYVLSFIRETHVFYDRACGLILLSFKELQNYHSAVCEICHTIQLDYVNLSEYKESIRSSSRSILDLNAKVPCYLEVPAVSTSTAA